MIVEKIRQELRKNVDHEYRNSVRKFTKKEDMTQRVTYYGVKTGTVRKIATKYYKKIDSKSKEEIFSLCDELLELRNSEERTVAFQWAFRLRKKYEPTDFNIFESWLQNYVTGWGSCDDLCTHALGYIIYRFPELVPKTQKWAISKNRWLRRAAAVTLIYSLRRKQLLEEAFETAGHLLMDGEDLVQKGYGWMLKEAANQYPEEVFQFVMDRKDTMPRTSLRYAIEKMPQEWRKKAMGRGMSTLQLDVGQRPTSFCDVQPKHF
ncbi:MAG: DNA alkylation repair protein [Euryarchaeota archaeon]|nr:DNA alkylation repair protein [Euryarchaeota archaeon]